MAKTRKKPVPNEQLVDTSNGEEIEVTPSKFPQKRYTIGTVVLDLTVLSGTGRLFVMNPNKGTEVGTELGGSYYDHVRGIVPDGYRWYYKSYGVDENALRILVSVQPYEDDPSLYSLADLPPEN